MRALSRLFRWLICERLAAIFVAGELSFFGDLAPLSDPRTFATLLASQRRRDWVVYAKRPFAGPEQVPSYLARYTHRIAISNSRITLYDGTNVTFRVKDYRRNGAARYGTMTFAAPEFARRFLSHVLPDGFHRIRRVGFLANTRCRGAIERAGALLADRTPPRKAEKETEAPAAAMAAPELAQLVRAAAAAWCSPGSSSALPGSRRGAPSFQNHATAHQCRSTQRDPA